MTDVKSVNAVASVKEEENCKNEKDHQDQEGSSMQNLMEVCFNSAISSSTN